MGGLSPLQGFTIRYFCKEHDRYVRCYRTLAGGSHEHMDPHGASLDFVIDCGWDEIDFECWWLERVECRLSGQMPVAKESSLPFHGQ